MLKIARAEEERRGGRLMAWWGGDGAARLQVPRPGRLPELVPLSRWFAALAPAARIQGGILAEADACACRLLAEPREPVALHGDIHHGNVLDAGARGWVAIDPKGLLGERTFDFVNILRNPDAATALAPGRFDRQVEVLVDAAALDRTRLLKWTLAFAGLSAAWHLADDEAADLDLAVAGFAAAALGHFWVGGAGKP